MQGFGVIAGHTSRIGGLRAAYVFKTPATQCIADLNKVTFVCLGGLRKNHIFDQVTVWPQEEMNP